MSKHDSNQNFLKSKDRGGFSNRTSSPEETESKIQIPSFDSPELLGKDAERLAKEIADGTELSITQVRNFYHEVKNIERILLSDENKWGELYGRVKLVKAKVVYNKNRDKNNEKKFKKFEQFISGCIDRITNDEKGKENFKIFVQLFEAVLGYAMEYLKNN